MDGPMAPPADQSEVAEAGSAAVDPVLDMQWLTPTLTNLESLGVFDQVEGLVVARPLRYPPDQIERFWEVVHERTARSAIPVLGDVECGHVDPMLTVPLGARARIDASAHEFEILEPATIGP
jgi:muramoyltetrapeptide carboxypeptidase